MIKLKSLITEKINTSKWRTGWDIIEDFDKISKFNQYRIRNAQYDDMYFLIPTDVFTKVTGLTERDVDRIDHGLEAHEGSINWENTNVNKHEENTVRVNGGS